MGATWVGSMEYTTRRNDDWDVKKPLPWWSDDKGGMSQKAPLSMTRSSFPSSYDMDAARAALTLYDAEKAQLWRRALSGGEPFTATSNSRTSWIDNTARRTAPTVCPSIAAEKKRDALVAAKAAARARERRQKGDDVGPRETPETGGGDLRWWTAEERAIAKNRPTFTSWHTTAEPFEQPFVGSRKGGRKFAQAATLPANWVPYEGE